MYKQSEDKYLQKYIYQNLVEAVVKCFGQKHKKTMVYFQVLRKALNDAGLDHIKIVAPDAPHIDDWKICVDLVKDPELAAAVDIVGYNLILQIKIQQLWNF